MLSEWHPPSELPDLRRAGAIALDTETKDNRLRADMGSGWPFRSGHLCGISVAFRAEGDIKMPSGDHLDEISALATMVDENRYQYRLDALCAWRKLPGKDETLLREGIAALGLITNKRRKVVPQEYLWQLPARYVGPYAEADAVSTLALFDDLNPVLDRE